MVQTVPTNAVVTLDIIGKREDLANKIWEVTLTDTPFLNIAEDNSGTATNTTHEFLSHTLRAVDGDNAWKEGSEFDGQAVAQPTRNKNYTQISRRDIVVTGTSEAVNKAGRSKETVRAYVEETKALKRDLETILTSNQAPDDGASSGTRKLRPLVGWYTTNALRGATGANGSATAQATDGTPRALTEDLFIDTHQKVYESGGRAGKVLAHPVQRRKINAFTGGATKFKDVSNKKIVGTFDTYSSPFGDLTVVNAPFARNREVHFIDPEYIGIAYLEGRKFARKPVGVTGDSEKLIILSEYTLEVLNERAVGVLADLT